MNNRRTFISGCLALLGLGATVKAEDNSYCDCKGLCKGHWVDNTYKVKTKYKPGQRIKINYNFWRKPARNKTATITNDPLVSIGIVHYYRCKSDIGNDFWLVKSGEFELID